MARKNKQQGPDEAAGAPEWMVTFSDCMTLLLTFFVLLLSFSSFDEEVFWKLKVIFANALPGIDIPISRDKSAFMGTRVIQHTEEVDKGSEKPTLTRENVNNLKKDTQDTDFNKRKVFLISSEDIFWGKGRVISFEGRKTLSTMASFIKEVPSRIVISENGPQGDEGSEHFGLRRAWAVMDYLTTKHGLDKNQFNLAAQSTIPQATSSASKSASQEAKNQRSLEIVLLEESIYN